METDGDPGLRSLGRFLYTQNPFYLISCFLILYGLQMATLSQADPLSRAIVFTGGIATYTLLMMVTCVAVVRLGKVWEDARSIFLIVLIGLVAFSIGLDELCISDWSLAALLLGAGFLMAIVLSEVLLWLCQIRFPSWYRLSYYALLSVFFAMPMFLGYAVSHRWQGITNWGALGFSSMIALAIALLVPAMRQGSTLLANNGTPWNWPLYPLSAFGLLVVLAGVRSHAIWMSFGFIGAPVRFEPFLLLPIALAILVLISEVRTVRGGQVCRITAFCLAPLMLLCGASMDGGTHLPIEADIHQWFGSIWTVSLLALIAFYGYQSFRRVIQAPYAMVATMIVLSWTGRVPEGLVTEGFQMWMVAAIAAAVSLIVCLLQLKVDWMWLGLGFVMANAAVIVGRQYHEPKLGVIVAAGVILLAMMAVGAVFRTQLAEFLRHCAAAGWVIAAGAVFAWHFAQDPGTVTISALLVMAAIALSYLQIVKRLGWLYVFALQMSGVIAITLWNAYQTGSFSGANWPIQSGLLCFAIGATITVVKSGFHRRWRRARPVFSYASGF